jgi:hypothetical protein
MGTRGQLAIPTEQIFGAEHISRVGQGESVKLGARKTDVIDAFQEHDVGNAR